MSDTAEVGFSAVLEWSPDGKRIYTQIGWHGECHLASVPAAGGALTMHMEGPINGRLGNIAGDGRSAALVVGSPTKLDEIHVAELGGGKARTTAISDLNGPLLGQRDVCRGCNNASRVDLERAVARERWRAIYHQGSGN